MLWQQRSLHLHFHSLKITSLSKSIISSILMVKCNILEYNVKGKTMLRYWVNVSTTSRKWICFEKGPVRFDTFLSNVMIIFPLSTPLSERPEKILEDWNGTCYDSKNKVLCRSLHQHFHSLKNLLIVKINDWEYPYGKMQ